MLSHAHAPLERDDAAECDHRGKEQQGCREAAGLLPDHAYDRRAREAAEIADRVDERETCRGPSTGEDRSRQRPERADRGIDADRGKRERYHDHSERQACCRPGESGAGEKERQRHVPDALAGEVGVPAPDHHGEAGKKIRHRGEEADL
jgi:hypothetical protein